MNTLHERLKATRFLVVDDSHFQRALTCETLRAAGAHMIEPASSPVDAQEVAKLFSPDVVLTDWVMDPTDGIEFTKMIRRHATLIKRDVPIIMITSRKTAADVQMAQNAGVDEYLVKPFNTDGILRRLDAVFYKRREFVDSYVYIGPCRRRKLVADYDGPMRRLFDDEVEIDEDGPQAQILKNLAKAKLATARDVAKTLTSGDRRAIRQMYAVAAEFDAVVQDISDPLLGAASKSLITYIQGVGASPRFDHRVVDAHIEAMTQLLDLSRAEDTMRARVAKALDVLVVRKLKA